MADFLLRAVYLGAIFKGWSRQRNTILHETKLLALFYSHSIVYCTMYIYIISWPYNVKGRVKWKCHKCKFENIVFLSTNQAYKYFIFKVMSDNWLLNTVAHSVFGRIRNRPIFVLSFRLRNNFLLSRHINFLLQTI